MQSIMNDFPEATAVDMESCSIAQVCYVYGVPLFRSVSSAIFHSKIPDASMYYDFWSKVAEGSFEVTKHFINTL